MGICQELWWKLACPNWSCCLRASSPELVSFASRRGDYSNVFKNFHVCVCIFILTSDRWRLYWYMNCLVFLNFQKKIGGLKCLSHVMQLWNREINVDLHWNSQILRISAPLLDQIITKIVFFASSTEYPDTAVSEPILRMSVDPTTALIFRSG